MSWQVDVGFGLFARSSSMFGQRPTCLVQDVESAVDKFFEVAR